MSGRRTPAWYWSRLELAISVGFVLLAGVNYVFAPEFMGGPEPQRLGAAAAFLGTLIGLAWMIRIARGPRDEPPPRRYRRR